MLVEEDFDNFSSDEENFDTWYYKMEDGHKAFFRELAHKPNSSQTEQPDAVELAIWFHDIIYNIPSIENELKSAELFLELTKGRINPDLGQSVYDMILITTHKTKPIRYDDKLLVDIDLSSFALPWEQFRQDSQHVREEFSNKTDQEFYSGHVKFLQSLLDKPRFFASEFFCTEFEVDARKNIEKLLKQLHGDGLS